MFVLEAIQHCYNSHTVLQLPHFEGAQGEHVLILGPSGSGKSTLLHIMAGLLTPTEGSVSIAGQDLRQLTAAALDRFRGRCIGIVFQRLHLVSALTILDNLRLAQYLAGLSQDRERIQGVLERLGIADKRDAYPPTLSFGEAQRAALARALVNDPKLILADEPTSNLDDAHCTQVLQLLEEQALSCDATLVVATHDQRIKARIGTRLELGERK
jgi:putative ABC transport system ATP-binding protein